MMKDILVVIQSFGFKYGMPAITDYMVDARFITNPFYVPELKNLTGQDKAVKEYITNQPKTLEFMNCLEGLIDCVVEKFEKDNKVQNLISVGCTGGRHRSVFVANAIGEHLSAQGFKTQVIHRDIDK